MRVLIFGDKGWIAGLFREFLRDDPDVSILNASDLGLRAEDTDLGSKLEAMKEMPQGVTHVLSLIGRTHGPGIPNVDYLENIATLKENLRDNLYGPLNLANACIMNGLHYTYMGTGCIFEYEEGRLPYHEDDEPNFFGSAYSVVKGFTDKLMRGYPVLNLRIRMPIAAGVSPRNFITKIVSYPRIISIPNSVSVLPTLFPCMIELMKTRYTGTLNFCNPGVISHNEILDMYKEIVNPSHTWENCSEDCMLTIARRSNNSLNTDKLTCMFPYIPDVHDAVRDIMVNSI
jgi:3,5-epimerase/4-reductase